LRKASQAPLNSGCRIAAAADPDMQGKLGINAAVRCRLAILAGAVRITAAGPSDVMDLSGVRGLTPDPTDVGLKEE